MSAARLVLTVLFLLLFTFFFMARPLTAQSVYGQVFGHLTTVAGTPVSGALVDVASLQTGVRAQTKSDRRRIFHHQQSGTRSLSNRLRADGFKRVHDTIAVQRRLSNHGQFGTAGGRSECARRTSATSASVLKLDRTDVSTLFDARTVTELPLLDRNLTQLQSLVPGAARWQALHPDSIKFLRADKPVNINGQHFSGSEFQMDGTENRDPLEGIVVINPTLDSVREMKVTTQGYNAEFGQATAGVVTIQTRSGSNTWHGDGFGFRRTGFGQSQDPFAPAGVPPSKYNIFGGSIGGPIVKNKLFIFGDYQGTRIIPRYEPVAECAIPNVSGHLPGSGRNRCAAVLRFIRLQQSSLAAP